LKTHDVLNQTPPMIGLNAYLGDPLLMQITKRFPQATRTVMRRIWPGWPIRKHPSCARMTGRAIESTWWIIIRPITR
jgi:hypothetical protein